MSNKVVLKKIDEIISEYIDHCYAEGFTKTGDQVNKKRTKYIAQLQDALKELEAFKKRERKC